MLFAELLSESCHFSCGSDDNHEEEFPCPTPVPTPVLHFASTGTHSQTAEAPKVVWRFRQSFGFQVCVQVFFFRVLGFRGFGVWGSPQHRTFDRHFSVWSNHVCPNELEPGFGENQVWPNELWKTNIGQVDKNPGPTRENPGHPLRRTAQNFAFFLSSGTDFVHSFFLSWVSFWWCS